MPAKPLEEKLGKFQGSVNCFTDVLHVVFSGDWKYMSRNPVCSARRKAGEGAEELSVRFWTTLNAWSKTRIP